MNPLRLKVQKRVFPNGLTLLMNPHDSVPTVSIAAFCDAGILCEPEEKAGLANLVAELLDEGSQLRSGEALSEEIESVGGQMETGSSGVSMGVPAGEIELGLRVLYELFALPVFPPSQIRKKKEWVLSDILSEEDDPRSKAYQQFRELVYGRHPLHRPSHGYRRTVSRLNRSDLLEYHRRYYAPDRLILSVAGAFVPSKIEKIIERTFGRWNRRGAAKPHFAALPRTARSREKVVFEEREQVNVYLGHLGIPRNHPDFYKLLVMDHVLGTGPGFTDRLSKTLRDEQGLAYTVHAGISSSSGKEPGTFSAYIGTSPERYDRAVNGIFLELKKIRESRPSREELQLAQDYLTGSYLFGIERNMGRAYFLINQERYALGGDYLERYPKIIRSITAGDVLEVARRHIRPQEMTVVAVGPVQQKKKVQAGARTSIHLSASPA